jgi:hypothetical protein
LLVRIHPASQSKLGRGLDRTAIKQTRPSCTGIIIIRKIMSAAAGTPLTGKHVNVAMMTSGGKQKKQGAKKAENQ